MAPSTDNTDNNTIAQNAAQWILALDEGDAGEQAQTRHDFELWQAADPRHAEAAKKAQAFIDTLTGLRGAGPAPARRALEAHFRQRATKRKRFVGTAIVLLLLMALPAMLFLQQYPWRHLDAGLYAKAGQWQSHTLEDGSRVTLAGKGAMDIQFTQTARELYLHSGEIHVDVAKDAQRPFVVVSDFGRIEALGTRFIVNHRAGIQTRLSMLESRVKVTIADTQVVIVKEGEHLSFDAHGLGPISQHNAAAQEARWQQHQLVVHGWTLAEVLAELSRFHPAYLHFDAETLPHIRVSAVLPLDKPDEVLQLLAGSFPAIQIHTITPWAILIRERY